MTELHLPISFDTTELHKLCKRWQIRKLAVFGSILRDDFHADSDIDMLVEFEETAQIGWEFVGLQDDLSEFFQRQVDLHTTQSLSSHFRAEVQQLAQVIYR